MMTTARPDLEIRDDDYPRSLHGGFRVAFRKGWGMRLWAERRLPPDPKIIFQKRDELCLYEKVGRSRFYASAWQRGWDAAGDAITEANARLGRTVEAGTPDRGD